eukprot:TRINITY_DN25453_c0_g1_i1.p1 TRINITY_DN25453_c0_g1~~TRINITY_DN25453_c0_g1_i1.p1  ORF type:complete len:396 (+),score=98.27 TRINITY_DN25453_c0_g1_i1:131-1318(+)
MCIRDRFTPLITQGRMSEARSSSSVHYKGVNYGHAGHFSVPAEHNASRTNHLFAWYQPCRGDCDPATAPLLIWLQGGPGGPGWFGAFAELGNWYIGGAQPDAEPHERCFSWCVTNNCLFVDQPVQTGFSFQTVTSSGLPVTDVFGVDYTSSSQGAMRQVLSVLKQFYKVFHEVAKAPLVITGESYGGLYTPHLGALLMEHNRLASDRDSINFSGLAVGDPAIDWEAQMPTYGGTLYGMGVLMLEERLELDATMEASVALLKKGECSRAFATWNAVWDDNGGLSPSEGHGWFANTTGSFNTANILMGNAPIGWDHISLFWEKTEALAAFHVLGIPQPTNGTTAQVAVNVYLSLIHISEPTRLLSISYAVFCLKKKKKKDKTQLACIEPKKNVVTII